MANQPQPRPWFRLGSLAQPSQPLPPPPAPAPRPQMQPPAAPLPRLAMLRPAFRPPVATQPQPVQDAAPPLQAPRPRVPPPSAPGRPLSSVTPAAVAPPLPLAPAVVSPVSPPKPLPRIATTSSVTQKSPPATPLTQKSPLAPSTTQNSPQASPMIQKSPLASPISQRSSPTTSSVPQKSSPVASPVTQKSPVASINQKYPLVSPVPQNTPASPVTQKVTYASPNAQKVPPAQRTSAVSLSNPSPSSPLSSPKPKFQSPPPSITSSPAMKQQARSMPASPAKLSSPSPPSQPGSPSVKQVVFATVPTYVKSSDGLLSAVSNPQVGVDMPSPAISPRAAKPLPETPPQSPKIKSALRSPPLFSLPPSQLKSSGDYETIIPAVAQQKTMIHAPDTVGKPRPFPKFDGDSSQKAQIGMNVKPKEREIKQALDSEDIGGMRVISISGENRGAIMELGFSPRTPGNPRGSVTNHQKLRSDGKLSEGILSDNEGRSKIQGRIHDARAKPSTPMHAFMNSNVQGINSSIVFNSTLSHHDPGVHLSLTGKPLKGDLKDPSNGHFFQKDAEYRFSD